jgi:uncharacterized delta-60 repeat protein
MSNDAWKSLKGALLICALSIAVSGFVATAAFADDGDPDPSFGGDGRAVASLLYGVPADMAIDAQGRIVVVGVMPRMMTWSFVARFNPDGSLDQSFGSGGFVWTDAREGEAFSSVAIDRAGRIVIGGSARKLGPAVDFTIVRLLENGQPDAGFDGDGRMTVDTGGSGDLGYDLALDRQGRILLAGSARIEEESRMVALRVTDAGALDAGFGQAGIATADFGGGEFSGEESAGRAIAVDSQGRVFVAGVATIYGNKHFAIAGFDAQGNPDASFSEDGKATVDFGHPMTEEVATDVVLDSQDRPVLVGSNGSTSALVARLLSGGSLDSSFSGDGKNVLPLPGIGSATMAAIDGADRVLVVGSLLQGEVHSAFLARLGQDGSLDGSFGAGGILREDFLSRYATGQDVAVDSAGRYLIVGRVYGPTEGLGLARYLNDQLRCRGKRATIVGTAKRDRLRGTAKRDVIVALGGNDRVRTFAGRDLVCAGSGRDVVRAGKGNDTVYGGRGADRLFGGAGKDRLRGGPGRDRQR